MNMSLQDAGSDGAPEPAHRPTVRYRGTGGTLDDDAAYAQRAWPDGPRWRTFAGGPCLPEPPDDDEADRRLGPAAMPREPTAAEVRLVNAALLLRRPLLVTGRPGVGKSGLAYRIARELRLGRVLQWPVSTRTTLTSALFEYDVLGRAQAGQAWYAAQSTLGRAPTGDERGDRPPDIGEFVQLGPLGTALLPWRLPRVVLIDEIDKSDTDLPNDLLHLFEDGWYAVPPLVRVKQQAPAVTVHTADPGGFASVVDGIVRCHAFPIVIMTSNGEREFPAAFMRRCLRLDVEDPDRAALTAMVAAQFGGELDATQKDLVRKFMEHSDRVGGLAADQLLNAAHLVTSGAYRPGDADGAEWQAVLEAIWHPPNGDGTG